MNCAIHKLTHILGILNAVSKNHKLGAVKRLQRPLDKQIIGFKGYEGQREKIKAVPNWQERLREFVDRLLKEIEG